MTTDIDALVERPDNAPASYDAVVEAYEHMRDMCRQAQDGWSEERRKLWRSIDENARLREALHYYADDTRWTMNSAGITPALDDKGHRARAALQGDA